MAHAGPGHAAVIGKQLVQHVHQPGRLALNDPELAPVCRVIAALYPLPRNYLIPTNVDERSTVLLNVQGVKQSEVLAILRGEAPYAAHYLVLDACATRSRAHAAAEGLSRSGS